MRFGEGDDLRERNFCYEDREGVKRFTSFSFFPSCWWLKRLYGVEVGSWEKLPAG